MAGGVISFVAWPADLPRLADWFGTGISIQPNTGVASTCSGLALFAFLLGYRRTGAALGAVIAFLGFTALIQYVIDVDFRTINTLLMFGREWGRGSVLSPGRMGPPGSLSWTLIGTSFLLWNRVGQVVPRLALTTLAIAGLSCVGYLYGADRLFSLPYLTAVALQTATFIAAVSLGILAAKPSLAPTRWFLETGATGAVARRGVPLIIVVPFLAGWIRLWGERQGWYDTSFGLAMLVVVLVILLLGMLFWFLRTITRHESALRTSRQQMEATLESIADGFVTLDREWRYRFVNAEAARLLEKTPDQLLGRVIWEIFPEAIGSPGYQAVHRVAAERTIAEFEDFNPVLDRWFSNRAYPTSDDAISIYFHDVTARKQAEKERATELAAMARLQSLSTTLVQSGELHSLLREILAAAIELTETTKGNIQFYDSESEELRILVHQGFGATFVQHFAMRGSPYGCGRAAQTRTRLVVSNLDDAEEWKGTEDLRVLLEDGIRAFQSTPLISRSGHLLGMMNTHFTRPRRLSEREARNLDVLARMAADLIERSQSEEARVQADRQKDEFLAMLAHELRNPLAPIQNAVHVLRQTNGSEDAVRYTTDMLQRQVGQLARLVDDLVDVNRITRGKIELDPEVVDLMAVVKQAVEAAKPLIDAKRQLLELKLPERPAFVHGDPTRLAQVVGNILSNASKFTSEGGQIVLRVEHDSATHVISVRDNGIGVAADQLPRIFDLFMQGDTSLERSVSGLGIGLTLVKTLVEMHGGTVEARSDGEGQGTEFIVRLPAVSNATLGTSANGDGNGRAKPSPHRRVLIVDDNQDGAQSLARILELSGHSTCTAHDGEEALGAADQFRPHVVLLDLGLPKLNGYEVCRRIREQPWGKSIMLVALTGWGAESYRQRSQEAGFDTHIVKPVTSDELMQILDFAHEQESSPR